MRIVLELQASVGFQSNWNSDYDDTNLFNHNQKKEGEMKPTSTTSKSETACSMPVAIYARMSTEHQKYSTENQIEAIEEYAKKNDMDIVRTYIDKGKSGLTLAGREALKQLISDVQSSDVAFKAILVFDISRWGRFQDADESAYYEYICRRAGIAVIYCAEQFENDGSPVSTIVKSVKRAMAGEYSRELSSKVFKGQCKLIQMGFRQGGTAGFGLRRRLMDQIGNNKGELKHGEQKSIQTDRVILVPGPNTEIRIVRQIYRDFIKKDKCESEIAEALNSQNIKTDMNRCWIRSTVHQVLTNEKYIGNNVYNRKSYKLKQKRIQNPPEIWVRAEGAFQSIVDKEMFFKAQSIILNRSRKVSDEEMLKMLGDLYKKHDQISAIIIDEYKEMPSSSTYRHRFGSLIRAYELIGYTPERDYTYLETNRRLGMMHPEVVEDVICQMRQIGGVITHEVKSGLIVVNGEIRLSIIIARCLQTAAGSYRWKIRLARSRETDITVVVRMDGLNRQILDYYLLPTLDMADVKLHMAESNGLWLDAYRFDTLDYLIGMAERAGIDDVA